MTKYISRRILLGGIASLAAGRVFGEAPLTSPHPTLRAGDFHRQAAAVPEDIVSRAKLAGTLGYVVADARSGQVLEAVNPALPLPPASVAKAVTAVYGLETLGAGHRFQTRLIATGPVKNGRLGGDLVLVGGGDPVLDTNDLADMVLALREAGLREISGRFRFHAGALPYQRVIDPGQPDHVGYNPAISGLNLNFNRVHFEWKRAASGYTVTMDARSDRFRPEVVIAQMRVVERTHPVYTFKQDGNIDRWTVARSALGNGGSRWLPVRRPDLYTAEVFRALAGAFGIRLPAATIARNMPHGTVLVTHESASLSAITRLMLRHSTNLTAEVIGLTASKARGHDPGSLKNSARMMSDWMKQSLGSKHADLKDHSGLSDASRLTASDMVMALVRTGPDGALHQLMKELVPRDAEGRKNPNARHVIRAKTGSLNFVSSLAGYIAPAGAAPLAFTIFTADIKRRAAIKRSDRERPEGSRDWARRSRRLQHQLINRWAGLYGG